MIDKKQRSIYNSIFVAAHNDGMAIFKIRNHEAGKETITMQKSTFFIEDHHTPPFFKKMPVSIELGQDVNVWDEQGRRYIDLTTGWGVTCLGHGHPAIIEALERQSRKIMQNPNSGATYSPARA